MGAMAIAEPASIHNGWMAFEPVFLFELSICINTIFSAYILLIRNSVTVFSGLPYIPHLIRGCIYPVLCIYLGQIKTKKEDMKKFLGILLNPFVLGFLLMIIIGGVIWVTVGEKWDNWAGRNTIRVLSS